MIEISSEFLRNFAFEIPMCHHHHHYHHQISLDCLAVASINRSTYQSVGLHDDDDDGDDDEYDYAHE